MDNWETAEQYVREYNEGLTAHSAYDENLQYLDSIQGKWNAIKENLASIGNNLISSDFAKGFLDVIESITNALAKLASTDLGQLSLFGGLIAGFKGVASLFKGGGLSKLLNIGDTADDLVDIASTGTKLTGVLGTVAKGAKTVGTSLLGLAVAHPILSMIAVSALAIGGAWLYTKNAQEKAREELEQSIKTQNEEIKMEKERVGSLREIAQEYDQLYWKANRSAEEQERYAELTRQIAEIAPELVTGYEVA